MTQQPWEPKYGAEVIDYLADWNTALAGDTIAGAVTATVIGSEDMTAVVVSTTDGISKVRVSGGGARANRSARISLTATTSSGQVLVASVPLGILAT